MTKQTNIYWKTALKKLKENDLLGDKMIDFRGEAIHVRDVLSLNRYGIKVPDDLIVYDDEQIDCSDIPEITLEDIESGKLVSVIPARIKVDHETAEWIKKSKINTNDLLSNLLRSFYQAMKSLSGKAAA